MPNEIELIDLGNDEETETVEAATQPETQNEKLLFLERRLNQMALSIDSINSLIKQMRSESRERIKREFAINQTVSKSMADKKLPVGLTLVGYTGGTPYYLEVAKDGFYVGINKYPSLSAAAQAVSGVRRSGWRFWRFTSGENKDKSIREVFRG